MAAKQLIPFLEDFNYNKKDNIISHERKSQGFALVDIEFIKKRKRPVTAKFTNKASNLYAEEEEHEPYATASRHGKIPKKLKPKDTHKFNISMESTDLRNDQQPVENL